MSNAEQFWEIKALSAGEGGTAAEGNREYLERLTDAVAVGEMHHTDAFSHLAYTIL